MQYSPKLKKAAAEIQSILDKYDIAGVVVLHTPGFGEFLCHLTPSYSCAKVNGDELRLTVKKSDFNGDIKKRDEVIKNTSNMLRILIDMTDPLIEAIEVASIALDKAAQADHGPSNSSSHIEQNN